MSKIDAIKDGLMQMRETMLERTSKLEAEIFDSQDQVVVDLLSTEYVYLNQCLNRIDKLLTAFRG